MKHYPVKNSNSKTFSRLVAAICGGVVLFGLLFLFYPVRITVYKTLAAGNREPFGPITAEHPLEYCIPFTKLDLDFNSADGVGIDSIEFLTATYQRKNASNITITFYDLLNGQKKLLGSQIFSSAILPDNSYFLIYLPLPFKGALGASPYSGVSYSDTPYSDKDSFCFSWKSDGNAENSATVWLNEYGEPVFRLKRSLPFYRALDYIQRAKH